MDTNEQFSLALRALREIQQEEHREIVPGQMLFPGLTSMVKKLGSVPPDALFFGMASDGLPLLLNLRNANPGPLLVVADQGSGKTLFLQLLAHAITRLLSPNRVRYAIVTDFPDEWDGFHAGAHCTGIYPTSHNTTIDLLYELACQAETGASATSTVLLFDGLDSALRMDPLGQENLRYLLASGPQACIWPIISINATRATQLPDWVSLFRARIYGRISNPEIADELTPIPGAGLNTLFPGAQFCMRQKSHWLRFWLPSL